MPQPSATPAPSGREKERSLQTPLRLTSSPRLTAGRKGPNSSKRCLCMAAKPNPTLASIQRKQRLNCHLWSWALSPQPPKGAPSLLAPGGVAWGILPCRQRHAAIHLRLLDVLSSGIAAHPQRFVVVNHDVSCPTGSLQGGKTKSEVHRHSRVVLGVGQQGQAAYPLQRPDHPLPPESNSAPRQAQLPSAMPAPRPPESTHSPSRGTLCC